MSVLWSIGRVALFLTAGRTRHDRYDAVVGVCGEGFATCALQKPNDIHFTQAGRQFTAVVVAHSIAQLLGPRWGQLTAAASGPLPKPPPPPPGPAPCNSTPQPCPSHPGHTFCATDKTPGQCDRPSVKICPPCPGHCVPTGSPSKCPPGCGKPCEHHPSRCCN